LPLLSLQLGAELDIADVMSGRLTPMYFGSAMSNFGVQDFLESFIDIAQSPGNSCTLEGRKMEPVSANFSGQVFKLQANMDPKHRDKVRGNARSPLTSRGNAPARGGLWRSANCYYSLLHTTFWRNWDKPPLHRPATGCAQF
jgi:hypothetical protein